MITLVTNVSQLVTPEGRGALFGAGMSVVSVFESVEILIEDGRITAIGPEGSVRPSGDVETLDAGGRIVLPGLVDPHRHLGFVPPRSSTRDEPADRARVESRLQRGIRRASRHGVTRIEVKCGRDLAGAAEVDGLDLVQRLDGVPPVRIVPTLLAEVSEADAPQRDDRISELISEVIPTVRRLRIAGFCDVVCGPGGCSPAEAETILRAARGAGLTPKVHLVGSETATGAHLGERLGAASVDHLISCTTRASAALRRSGVIGVLLPGNSFVAGKPYPDARRMIEDGLALALGTDYGFQEHGVESPWVALSFAVARAGMTLEEGIVACTLNAAAALEMADEAGSVEIGKAGDLAILETEDYREIATSIGANPVWRTVIGGKVVDPS